MTLEELKNKIIDDYSKDALNWVKIHISGSQGVSPNEVFINLDNYNTIEELEYSIASFIDENAMDYVESYMDYYDEEEAFTEAVNDSGDVYIMVGEPMEGCIGTGEDVAEYILGDLEWSIKL